MTLYLRFLELLKIGSGKVPINFLKEIIRVLIPQMEKRYPLARLSVRLSVFLSRPFFSGKRGAIKLERIPNTKV